MSQRFYFDGIRIDRAAHLRRDETLLPGSLDGHAARVIPIWRDRSLVDASGSPAAVFLDETSGRSIVEAASVVVFLGLDNGTAYFAADLSHHEAPETLTLPQGAVFEDLRRLATDIDAEQAGYLAYARALAHWHRNHLYCGACGTETRSRKGGHERKCPNPDCGRSHFPRTDPAVIMLIIHPDGDKCLLGHNKRFQGLRFSTIAGFVEPGETLEQAVAREVLEETSIAVEDVRYQGSQPWPFPASIMLGFRGRAVSTEIHCADEELLEARWFTRDQVRELAEQGDVLPPSHYSISRWLIDTWLFEG